MAKEQHDASQQITLVDLIVKSIPQGDVMLFKKASKPDYTLTNVPSKSQSQRIVKINYYLLSGAQWNYL